MGVYKARFAYRALIVPIYLACASPPPRTARAGFSPYPDDDDDPRDAAPSGVELSARSRPGRSLPEVRSSAGVGITVSCTRPLPALPGEIPEVFPER